MKPTTNVTPVRMASWIGEGNSMTLWATPWVPHAVSSNSNMMIVNRLKSFFILGLLIEREGSQLKTNNLATGDPLRFAVARWVGWQSLMDAPTPAQLISQIIARLSRHAVLLLRCIGLQQSTIGLRHYLNILLADV